VLVVLGVVVERVRELQKSQLGTNGLVVYDDLHAGIVNETREPLNLIRPLPPPRPFSSRISSSAGRSNVGNPSKRKRKNKKKFQERRTLKAEA